MPLYLGQLRPRPPNQYSAILTYRPDKPSPDVDALLALGLGTGGGAGGGGTAGGPLFCFMAEGRVLVLPGYQQQAVFYALLFFMQYHKVGGLWDCVLAGSVVSALKRGSYEGAQPHQETVV